jgi:hypothetical protein
MATMTFLNIFFSPGRGQKKAEKAPRFFGLHLAINRDNDLRLRRLNKTARQPWSSVTADQPGWTMPVLSRGRRYRLLPAQRGKTIDQAMDGVKSFFLLTLKVTCGIFLSTHRSSFFKSMSTT